MSPTSYQTAPPRKESMPTSRPKTQPVTHDFAPTKYQVSCSFRGSVMNDITPATDTRSRSSQASEIGVSGRVGWNLDGIWMESEDTSSRVPNQTLVTASETGPVTVQGLLDEYLNDPTAHLRSAVTQRNYRQVLRQLTRSGGDRPVRDWTEEDLACFCLRSDLASSSQRTFRTVVSSFFSWAEYRGHVETDPARHLRRLVHPTMNPVRQHHWLSREEVRRVLDTCEDDLMGRRDRVILTIGFYTGLRRSEIAALCWGAIQHRHMSW